VNKYATDKSGKFSKFSTKRVLLERLPQGKDILDIGCNDGFFGRKSLNNRFWGLDIDPEALEVAHNHYMGTLEYDLNDCKPLPWEKKFDVIIFADVLEHVIDPPKVLKYFTYNYLSPTGVVLISLPNIANWQPRLNLLFGRFDYTSTGIMDSTHLHFYTYKTAISLVSVCNLCNIKVFFGADVFGPFIKLFPFLRNLLSTNIILECWK